MSYLTEKQLISLREQYRGTNTSRIFKERAKFEADVTIFLSHSHLDKLLIEGFIYYLAQFGLDIYVDWQDSEMPRITNKDTASLIKQKIQDLDMFWIFATENAMNSKWVPWEIGVGDVVKEGKVFIIPVANDFGKFYGNEYLQLYEAIEISDDKNLAAFKPNQVRGVSLENIMQSRGRIFR
ncbi:TIR domain-containing protein [Leptospira yasudae]|uniref:TIR domain-containing protein n=1 Tax=Leptospira yasudae TaxID=2202201 RepID=A0A6N4QWH2_9LEPT|nr:TIR domain-containing protein [Leptospira yasudae]TGL75992.1 hypothetical protein EHQ72_14500 [Leptospira yasudae]TGL79736.1 hypothetical protein EHQ83_17850 [Leptospira yasudae]TGL80108.1 hypothetical protein EHQ77_09015 [Leptospira yasudae]